MVYSLSMIMNRSNFLGYFLLSHHLSVFTPGSAVVIYSLFFSILLMLCKSAKYFQISVWKDKYNHIMNSIEYFLICTCCSRSFHYLFSLWVWQWQFIQIVTAYTSDRINYSILLLINMKFMGTVTHVW